MIISLAMILPLSGGFSADSESLLNDGIEAYNVKNNKAAKELLLQSLAMKKTGKGYYYLGNVLMNLRDYEHARFAYISALENKYDINNTIFNLACASSLLSGEGYTDTFLRYNYICGDRNISRIRVDPDLEYFRIHQSADNLADDFKKYGSQPGANIDDMLAFVASENPETDIQRLNSYVRFMRISFTLIEALQLEKSGNLSSAASCYFEVSRMEYYPEKYLAKAALLQQKLKDYDSCLKTLVSLYSINRKGDPSLTPDFAPFRASSGYTAYKKIISSMKDGYHPKNAEELKKAVIGKDFLHWGKLWMNLNPDSTSVLTNLYTLSVGGDGGTGRYKVEKWDLDEKGLTISDFGMSIRKEEYFSLSDAEKKKYTAFRLKSKSEIVAYILKNPLGKDFYQYSDIYIDRIEEFYHASGDLLLQKCVVIRKGRKCIYFCQDMQSSMK
jgi:tetratricopeptide (TPR) repeat protein